MLEVCYSCFKKCAEIALYSASKRMREGEARWNRWHKRFAILAACSRQDATDTRSNSKINPRLLCSVPEPRALICQMAERVHRRRKGKTQNCLFSFYVCFLAYISTFAWHNLKNYPHKIQQLLLQLSSRLASNSSLMTITKFWLCYFIKAQGSMILLRKNMTRSITLLSLLFLFLKGAAQKACHDTLKRPCLKIHRKYCVFKLFCSK